MADSILTRFSGFQDPAQRKAQEMENAPLVERAASAMLSNMALGSVREDVLRGQAGAQDQFNAIQQVTDAVKPYGVQNPLAVRSLGDAWQAANNVVGQMLPVMYPSMMGGVAAGVLNPLKQSRLASAITGTLGAAAPSYNTMYGMNLMDQYNDPVLSKQTPQAQLDMARGVAARQAIFEALLPGMATTKGGVGGVMGHMATEAATEATQDYIAQKAAMEVDKGRQLNTQSLLENAAAGALGGGVMGASFGHSGGSTTPIDTSASVVYQQMRTAAQPAFQNIEDTLGRVRSMTANTTGNATDKTMSAAGQLPVIGAITDRFNDATLVPDSLAKNVKDMATSTLDYAKRVPKNLDDAIRYSETIPEFATVAARGLDWSQTADNILADRGGYNAFQRGDANYKSAVDAYDKRATTSVKKVLSEMVAAPDLDPSAKQGAVDLLKTDLSDYDARMEAATFINRHTSAPRAEKAYQGLVDGWERVKATTPKTTKYNLEDIVIPPAVNQRLNKFINDMYGTDVVTHLAAVQRLEPAKKAMVAFLANAVEVIPEVMSGKNPKASDMLEQVIGVTSMLGDKLPDALASPDKTATALAELISPDKASTKRHTQYFKELLISARSTHPAVTDMSQNARQSFATHFVPDLSPQSYYPLAMGIDGIANAKDPDKAKAENEIVVDYLMQGMEGRTREQAQAIADMLVNHYTTSGDNSLVPMGTSIDSNQQMDENQAAADNDLIDSNEYGSDALAYESADGIGDGMDLLKNERTTRDLTDWAVSGVPTSRRNTFKPFHKKTQGTLLSEEVGRRNIQDEKRRGITDLNRGYTGTSPATVVGYGDYIARGGITPEALQDRESANAGREGELSKAAKELVADYDNRIKDRSREDYASLKMAAALEGNDPEITKLRESAKKTLKRIDKQIADKKSTPEHFDRTEELALLRKLRAELDAALNPPLAAKGSRHDYLLNALNEYVIIEQADDRPYMRDDVLAQLTRKPDVYISEADAKAQAKARGIKDPDAIKKEAYKIKMQAVTKAAQRTVHVVFTDGSVTTLDTTKMAKSKFGNVQTGTPYKDNNTALVTRFKERLAELLLRDDVAEVVLPPHKLALTAYGDPQFMAEKGFGDKSKRHGVDQYILVVDDKAPSLLADYAVTGGNSSQNRLGAAGIAVATVEDSRNQYRIDVAKLKDAADWKKVLSVVSKLTVSDKLSTPIPALPTKLAEKIVKTDLTNTTIVRLGDVQGYGVDSGDGKTKNAFVKISLGGAISDLQRRTSEKLAVQREASGQIPPPPPDYYVRRKINYKAPVIQKPIIDKVGESGGSQMSAKDRLLVDSITDPNDAQDIADAFDLVFGAPIALEDGESYVMEDEYTKLRTRDAIFSTNRGESGEKESGVYKTEREQTYENALVYEDLAQEWQDRLDHFTSLPIPTEIKTRVENTVLEQITYLMSKANTLASADQIRSIDKDTLLGLGTFEMTKMRSSTIPTPRQRYIRNVLGTARLLTDAVKSGAVTIATDRAGTRAMKAYKDAHAKLVALMKDPPNATASGIKDKLSVLNDAYAVYNDALIAVSDAKKRNPKDTATITAKQEAAKVAKERYDEIHKVVTPINTSAFTATATQVLEAYTAFTDAYNELVKHTSVSDMSALRSKGFKSYTNALLTLNSSSPDPHEDLVGQITDYAVALKTGGKDAAKSPTVATIKQNIIDIEGYLAQTWAAPTLPSAKNVTRAVEREQTLMAQPIKQQPPEVDTEALAEDRKKLRAEDRKKLNAGANVAPPNIKLTRGNTTKTLFDKDQLKAKFATKFIGFGLPGSSTARYAEDAGAVANTGSYTSDDIVFVSINGKRATMKELKPYYERTLKELEKAVAAAATIVTDDATNRVRPYNIGEREVAAFLRKKGYDDADGKGVWRKVTPKDFNTRPVDDPNMTPIDDEALIAATEAFDRENKAAAASKVESKGKGKGGEKAGITPVVTEPVVTKPAATKPAATKPAATKPAATKPAATKPAATKPAATKPVVTKPAATKPTPTPLVSPVSKTEQEIAQRVGEIYDQVVGDNIEDTEVLGKLRTELLAMGEREDAYSVLELIDSRLIAHDISATMTMASPVTPTPPKQTLEEALAGVNDLSAPPPTTIVTLADAEAYFTDLYRNGLIKLDSFAAGIDVKYTQDMVDLANNTKISEKDKVKKRAELDQARAKKQEMVAKRRKHIERTLADALAKHSADGTGTETATSTTPPNSRATKSAKDAFDASVGRNPTAKEIRSLTRDELDKLRDSIIKMRGNDVAVKFVEALGGRSSHTVDGNGKRIISVAIASLNPLSQAYHESMHDLLHVLRTQSAETRTMYHDMRRAASSARVMYRLRELLKDSPEALEQIEYDKDERVAYMFQFIAEGTMHLKKTEGIVTRIINAIRRLLGEIPIEERAVLVMDMLMRGDLAVASRVHDVISSSILSAKDSPLAQMTAPLRWVADRLFTISVDQLRGMGYESLDEIADMFWRPPEREGVGDRKLGFLDQVARDQNVLMNGLMRILADSSEEQRVEALKRLQSMKDPVTPLEKALAGYLDHLYDHLIRSGVTSINPKDGGREALRKVNKYFPRLWDITIENQDAFRKLLIEQGNMSPSAADAMIIELMGKDGFTELADTPELRGITPIMPNVMRRKLDFINASNAHLFEPFQSKDMMHIMNIYIRAVAHRATFAQHFEDDGSVLHGLLKQAEAEGATPAEIDRARDIIDGMLGTLGANMNPYVRSMQNALITIQNLAILPLALLSSFLDPLGVAVRTQSMENAWLTFKTGISDMLVDAGIIKDSHTVADYERRSALAEDLGIAADQNTMDAMGYTHVSFYMSKLQNKINDKFFRMIGMNSWNNSMRRTAATLGVRYIREKAIKKDTVALRELGLDLDDVVISGNLIAINPKEFGTDPKAQQRSEHVRAALYQFTNSAILRPNASVRATWMNDPRWLLISYLKGFTYSFQNVIMRRVAHMADRGEYMPAAVLAAYVPMQLGVNILRSMVNGTFWNRDFTLTGAMVSQAIQNSGILGQGSFIMSAAADNRYGNMTGASFLGPVFDHVSTMFNAMVGEGDSKTALIRTLPGGSAIRGWV